MWTSEPLIFGAFRDPICEGFLYGRADPGQGQSGAPSAPAGHRQPVALSLRSDAGANDPVFAGSKGVHLTERVGNGMVNRTWLQSPVPDRETMQARWANKRASRNTLEITSRAREGRRR
jgi:hypothetical protein